MEGESGVTSWYGGKTEWDKRPSNYSVTTSHLMVSVLDRPEWHWCTTVIGNCSGESQGKNRTADTKGQKIVLAVKYLRLVKGGKMQGYVQKRKRCTSRHSQNSTATQAELGPLIKFHKAGGRPIILSVARNQYRIQPKEILRWLQKSLHTQGGTLIKISHSLRKEVMLKSRS